MTRAPESSAEASGLDGRVQRGARNRERIVDALLELVRAGELRPTAEQVADRAGVGTRTVFRHFDDMESLYAEMNEAIQSEGRQIVDASFDASGSLSERIDLVVERRAAVFEYITPFKRAAALQLWRSGFLREQHNRMNRGLRKQLLEALPELAAQGEAAQDAAELATSFESWNRLRGDQRLGHERAAAAVRAVLHRLLGNS